MLPPSSRSKSTPSKKPAEAIKADLLRISQTRNQTQAGSKNTRRYIPELFITTAVKTSDPTGKIMMVLYTVIFTFLERRRENRMF
jgi:hypothetical protein